MSRVTIRAELEVPFDEWQAAVRAGDRERFGLVLQAFRRRLLAEARRALPPEVRPRVSDSDLVQDTCGEAHDGFEGFRGRSCTDLWRWLRSILRNNARQARRQHLQVRKRAAGGEVSLDVWLPADDLADPDAPAPIDVLIRRHEVAAVAAAVGRLPDRERECVLLRYESELSYGEIAGRLGCSPSAARQAVARALRRVNPRGLADADGPRGGPAPDRGP